ncbi:MAG: ceramidase [Methylococcaceae bacterium]|nr:ceramidase [Methylococcaceae bacterium]
MHHDHRIRIIWIITLVAIIAVFNFAPIAQDPAYHRFADQRLIAGLPNFFNVISNIPFVLIGFTGMHQLVKQMPAGGLADLRWIYFAFFAGVFLTGIGSSYYHLHPDNRTLVWDRLPMMIGFMALFSAVVGEYISTRAARAIFVPLLIVGLVSVIYWHFTELSGQGDLRPYALVQFLPIILIPVILCLFKSGLQGNAFYWGMIAVYALSKAAEFFDVELYELVGAVSGHALKHLIAAVAPYMFYRALRQREPIIRAA